MAHGTGRGGCYDIALEYKNQSPTQKGKARLWEDTNGVSTIKLNQWQGLHTSSIGTPEYYNLIPYFEDLNLYQNDPQGGIDFHVVLKYQTQTVNPLSLRILEVVPGEHSVKLVVERINGNSPNFEALEPLPSIICFPHPPGESSDDGDFYDDGSIESDENRAGDGPVDDGVTLEYTTDIKVLEDILPGSPLIYDGDDLTIIMDLRLITYKPSALAEILDPTFKSY
jgi:hypothetical protein